MSREGCHLCEVAEADVARICGELGVPWETADVDSDPEWQAEYGPANRIVSWVETITKGTWRKPCQRYCAWVNSSLTNRSVRMWETHHRWF